jgi:hypothetical protein
MDDSEKLANSYLANLGFESIVFEPDGNVPPDFLADARIAVEVRRLNQNELTQSGFRSLEEVAIPLQMKIGKLLASLGPANGKASWFVHYSFKRPLLSWDQLAFKLQQCLEALRVDPRNEKLTSITVDDCLEVRLIRAGDPQPTFFVSGGYHDDDSGGWVFEETQKNLRLCLEEKTRKITPFRHKYPEWWLVLIDRIGYGVHDRDRDLFRKHLRLEHDWDRIVLLNPLDPTSAFELYRSGHCDKEE